MVSGEERLLAEAERVGESVDVGGCLRRRGWCTDREGLKTCFCALGEEKCTLAEGELQPTIRYILMQSAAILIRVERC